MHFAGVSVIGSSHQSTGKPNEDYFVSKTLANGWHVCVVCDGCGSSKYADIGSRLTGELVAFELVDLVNEISEKAIGDWIIDEIIERFAWVRKTLRTKISRGTLSDYSATIIATLVSETGGFLIHIGDGIGSILASDAAHREEFNLTTKATSLPENGEYANQTFYLTEPNWIRHIRITPFENCDICILCTDGAQSLFFTNNLLQTTQLKTILNHLDITNETIETTKLAALLDSESAKQLSTDDKTIAILLSDAALAFVREGMTPITFPQLRHLETLHNIATNQNLPDLRQVASKSAVSTKARHNIATFLRRTYVQVITSIVIFSLVSAVIGFYIGYRSKNDGHQIEPQKTNDTQQSKTNADVGIENKNGVKPSAGSNEQSKQPEKNKNVNTPVAPDTSNTQSSP